MAGGRAGARLTGGTHADHSGRPGPDGRDPDEEIDFRSAKDFEAELTAAVEAALAIGVVRLLLDVEKVQFLDSGGVSTLIDARERLAEQHTRLELVNAQRPVVRALEVLGLLTNFAITT